MIENKLKIKLALEKEFGGSFELRKVMKKDELEIVGWTTEDRSRHDEIDHFFTQITAQYSNRKENTRHL